MKAKIPVLLAVLAAACPAASASAETINVAPFGDVSIYRPSDEIKSVALLLSDDKGWSPTETGIATQLTDANTLVVGVDSSMMLKHVSRSGKACVYPAGSLQDLARSVEKQLDLKDFTEPMLVGYAAGSTLAYAAIAEAPANTFKGGIGFSFCPHLKTARPLCKGAGLAETPTPGGGYTVGPADSLGAPFTVLQGSNDSQCKPEDTHSFFASTNGATVVDLANADHGFSHSEDYRDQLVDEYWQIAGTDSSFKLAASAASDGLQGLPLTEIRDDTVKEGDSFAIFLSGDGGWADLDSSVSEELAKRGIPVVGVSSLKYFWRAQTPESVAADIGRIAGYYLKSWNKKRFVLVGYSFGADVMPFAANRLNQELRSKLAGLAILSPSHNAEFEFHVADWLGADSTGPETKPEIDKLSPLPVLCIHGENEDDSICPELTKPNMRDLKTSGGHHLGSAYEPVAEAIAKLAPS